MKQVTVMVAVVAAALAGGVARAAPLEAYGRLPSMEQVSISPDGGKVAFVQQVGGKYTVVVDQLSPAAIVAEIAPTDQKVRALVWADPTHLLVVKSKTGYAAGVRSPLSEWGMVKVMDLTTRKVSDLFGQAKDFGPESRLREQNIMNTVRGAPFVRTVNGRVTVFAPGTLFLDRKGTAALLSADLATGRESVVANALAPDQERSWVVDEQGATLAEETYDQTTHIWSLRVKRAGAWADVYSVKALNDPPVLRGLNEDGSSLLLTTIDADGRPKTAPLVLTEGKLGPATDRYDPFDHLIRDPISRRVIGGVKIGIEPAYVFFDPKDQAAWDAVAKTFPGEGVDLVGWSNDRTKVVVLVTGAQHGVSYVVVDLTSRKAMEIGQAYAGVKGDDVADVAIVRYPAKDGLTIQAFLTLPVGRDPKNLPLIVLPHGGPAARDGAGFDWWAQALASKGYAVLQPQFRGSDGLGWELAVAGFGEFGRKMQSDLSDGVQALAAKGYVDPKRVCIVGASYGGYAALAGVTLQQGSYRCAVAVAGVSDLRKMMGGFLADPEHSLAVRYWDRMVGAKDQGDPLFDQISPLRHAAQAGSPILLIHGKDDTVVPIDQSWKMEAALKGAGKPVEFVTLNNEDHWLSREDTRVQMLQATVAFLEKNNPAK